MTKPRSPARPRKQVAALPIRRDARGRLLVLLITSRDTQRLIVPKGWPMRGRKDHRVAAIEAKEEAGVIGRVHRKPIGSYLYWKHRPGTVELCRVKVFVLEVEVQLPAWREMEQRRGAWLSLDDAADLVDDVGLADIIRRLSASLSDRPSPGSAEP